MVATSERQIVLDAETYKVVNDAVNTIEIDRINFRGVSEALPVSMTPPEIEDLRAQYFDELFARNPNWDDSVQKRSTRLVFTIGQAACFEGQDRVTAKSAEKVLWRQRTALSWLNAVVLRWDIRRYAPKM